MNNEPRPTGPDQQAESADKTFERYLLAVTERLLQAEFSVAEVIDQYKAERARFTVAGGYRTDTRPDSHLHEHLQRAVADGWPPATVAAALGAEIDRLSRQFE